jgi:hypothetical protein
VQQDPGRRGEGGGVVASKGFHADEELSKKGWHDSERHTLKGVAEEGSGVGVQLGATQRKVDGGGVFRLGVVRQIRAALSEAAARARGGGGLANRV